MFISVEIHSGGRVLRPRGLIEVSPASSLQDVFDCFKNLETTVAKNVIHCYLMRFSFKTGKWS